MKKLRTEDVMEMTRTWVTPAGGMGLSHDGAVLSGESVLPGKVAGLIHSHRGGGLE
jgi:hypothetical protein